MWKKGNDNQSAVASDQIIEKDNSNSEPVEASGLKKPFMSSAQLIAECLDNSPSKTLFLSDIIEAIHKKHPFFDLNSDEWQTEISLNLDFVVNFVPIETDNLDTNSWKLEIEEDYLFTCKTCRTKHFGFSREHIDNCWQGSGVDMAAQLFPTLQQSYNEAESQQIYDGSDQTNQSFPQQYYNQNSQNQSQNFYSVYHEDSFNNQPLSHEPSTYEGVPPPQPYLHHTFQQPSSNEGVYPEESFNNHPLSHEPYEGVLPPQPYLHHTLQQPSSNEGDPTQNSHNQTQIFYSEYAEESSNNHPPSHDPYEGGPPPPPYLHHNFQQPSSNEGDPTHNSYQFNDDLQPPQ